jgi:hypothetical protein
MMLRRLNNDFMCPEAIHFVINTLSSAVELTFYPQSREFIGNDPYTPPRGVGVRTRGTLGKDFGRGLVFVAGAKRAEATSRVFLG